MAFSTFKSHTSSKKIIQKITFVTGNALIGLSYSPLSWAGNILSVAVPSIPEIAQIAEEKPYTLGAGDSVRIDIFNVPELTNQYQVLVDGTLNLPWIGTVVVQGLSLRQAADVITQRYSPFLANPIITLSLLEQRPLQIAIAGEVSRPGSYTLSRQGRAEGIEGLQAPTITGAIRTAGGITQAADIRNVQIFRPPNQLISVDLWSLSQRSDLSQDISLRDGDRIFVPTATQINLEEAPTLSDPNFAAPPNRQFDVAVVGEVTRPGSYTLRGDGEKGLTLTVALQAASGVTQAADIRNIQVLRRTAQGDGQVIGVNLWQLLQQGDIAQDITLQQGDTIFVPTNSNVDLAEAARLAETAFSAPPTRQFDIAVVGEVSSPGSYTLRGDGENGLTLTVALRAAGGITQLADIRSIQVLRRTAQGSGQQTISINLWQLLQAGDTTQDVTLQQGDTIFIPTATNVDLAESARLAAATFAANPKRQLDIAVVGEINRPGSYTLTGDGEKGLTITRALQAAGGITQVADVRNIQIRRTTQTGSERVIDVDLWQLVEAGDISQDAILQQGDTIVVPTAQNLDLAEAPQLAAASFSPSTIRVNVVGEVIEPGVVEVPPNISLNQAILAAGGFDPSRARTSKVELIRLNPNGTVSRQTIPIDFSQGLDEENNPTLRNNDVVIVGRSSFTQITDTLGTVLGPVLPVFGVFRFFEILF